MLEFFGIPLGTPFQGATVALIMVFGAMAIWFIRGMPERARVKNEADTIENSDAALLRAEYAELNRANRKDIHDLRNKLAIVAVEQHDCAKRLAEAHAINRVNRDDMASMMFLIRLLISEVKRLDPDPENNIIIKQCEQILNEIDRKKGADHDGKSAALSAAEETVDAAVHAVEEVKQQEGAGK